MLTVNIILNKMYLDHLYLSQSVWFLTMKMFQFSSNLQNISFFILLYNWIKEFQQHHETHGRLMGKTYTHDFSKMIIPHPSMLGGGGGMSFKFGYGLVLTPTQNNGCDYLSSPKSYLISVSKRGCWLHTVKSWLFCPWLFHQILLLYTISYSCFILSISGVCLTQCGIMMPYGDKDLGQHWLR